MYFIFYGFLIRNCKYIHYWVYYIYYIYNRLLKCDKKIIKDVDIFEILDHLLPEKIYVNIQTHYESIFIIIIIVYIVAKNIYNLTEVPSRTSQILISLLTDNGDIKSQKTYDLEKHAKIMFAIDLFFQYIYIYIIYVL